MSVVIVHSSGSFFGITLVGGTLAVQLFYVISGFLITLVVGDKYQITWRGLWLFYSNRYLRIWVPYIVVAVATFLYMKVSPLLGGVSLGGSTAISLKHLMYLDAFSVLSIILLNILIFGQDIGMLLAHDIDIGIYFSMSAMTEPKPFYQFYIMDQTWTLGIELSFYLIAPFIVRRRVWFIVFIMLISICFRLFVYEMGLNFDPWTYRFFPFELAFFMAGSLACKAYIYINKLNIKEDILRYIGYVAIIAVVLWQFVDKTRVSNIVLFFIVVPTLPMLFAATKDISWDRFLGDLSYPLYLVHIPIILIFRSHPFLSEKIGTNVYVVLPLSFLAAWLICIKIEQPLEKIRQNRLLKKS